MNQVAKIQYEKVYTDDIGKFMPSAFSSQEITCISTKTMWAGAVDAFYRNQSPVYFSCLSGDIRVIVVTDDNEDNYRFSQYFLSGMDGKILKVYPNTWYGAHNLRENTSVFLGGLETMDDNPERLSSKIFNWHSKR